MDKVVQVLLNALVRYFETHPGALEQLIESIIAHLSAAQKIPTAVVSVPGSFTNVAAGEANTKSNRQIVGLILSDGDTIIWGT